MRSLATTTASPNQFLRNPPIPPLNLVQLATTPTNSNRFPRL